MYHTIHNPSEEQLERIRQSGVPVITLNIEEATKLFKDARQLTAAEALEKLKTHKP
jgi:hypothetical protein